ncbi:alpha/beta fold hydrolase [Flagellimonas algicola]|uniref:exo-alpha-sialidase n=1 Tax=Flagellimonas algicola TaxID=2583815 RepID=A0ABY2WIL3_9FLAO|nr:alpha/beta fold hydrolase [Allomuricauda algicola]TMU54480.1 alpha/beta fold hydrolase [Allomuricauda algicola]
MHKFLVYILLAMISGCCLGQKPKKSETIKVNGTEIHYQVYGSGEPLLLLHGWTQSSKFWSDYIPSYAKHFEVHALDLRGHGKSSQLSSDFSIKKASKDVLALLDALKIQKVHAIGLSYGGLTLLELASSHPDRLASMVLIGASHHYDGRNNMPDTTFSYENLPPTFIEELNRTHFRGENQIKALFNPNLNYSIGLEDGDLRGMNIRTLVVQGDGDEILGLEPALTLHKNLPQSELWVVPNTGHIPITGANQQVFLRKSLQFLTQGEKIATDPKFLQFQNLFDSKNEAEIACYRIPALITAPNGDLIAAIDERVPSCGDLKWSKDINIVIRRSTDNGDSWTQIESVVDYPLGQSASDPSLMVDKVTGSIFMFFNFMDLDKEKDIYYLKYIKSTDNGKTWSSHTDITSQISKSAWHNDFKFITSGRGIQTRSGKLLHTLVNLEKGLHLFGSDDHGKSWYLIDTPISPGDESKVMELDDGSWMVNSRVNGKGIRYVHTSSDKGKTWTSVADATLVDPGCNASIIRYSSKKDGDDKNRLLFAHANDKDERKNLTVHISYDEGKSWSNGKTIYAGSSAYSSMTVLDNGDIGLFFEKDEYQESVFTRFSLHWLTDGKDGLNKSQQK